MPRGKKNTTPTEKAGQKLGPAVPSCLAEATYENTPKFSLEGYRTQAKCVRVYDGDTAHFAFSLPPHGVGEASLVRERCRLAGYNTAEMKGETAEERLMAQSAKLYLEKAILGKVLDVSFGDYDLYGRPLLTVFIPRGEAKAGGAVSDKQCTQETWTLAEYMIAAGLARPYGGSGEKAWK